MALSSVTGLATVLVRLIVVMLPPAGTINLCVAYLGEQAALRQFGTLQRRSGVTAWMHRQIPNIRSAMTALVLQLLFLTDCVLQMF